MFSEPVTGGYRIQTKDVRGIASATQRDEHPLNGGGISWEEAEVNANLISAAKELYAAAELSLRVLPIAGESDKQDEARLVLRSALAKAKGEQQ